MSYARLTHDTFYLTDEQLENSPSRKDGIDRDTEAELRSYGCTLVQEAGILLAFPQAVMATGQVLLHRFYCKRSMKHFNVKKLAATALWHGAKLEEVPEVSGHPRELLNKVMVAVDRCIARRENPEGRKLSVLDLHSKEAEEFRRSLIRYELEMLKAFGFITHVEHPHKLLLNYCQILGLGQPQVGAEQQDPVCPEFLQEAWNVANDSLRTSLCVRHKGSVVACGIIFYTSRRLKVALPESPPWWTLFSVALPQIYEVAAALHQLYRAPKPRFIPVCHQLLPSKPPTPASAAAPAEGAVDTGATPLPGRPGRPLDPSVRRTLGELSTRGVASTPGQVSAANGTAAAPSGIGSSTPAAAASAPPSAGPSPQEREAPGSAQQRKRSRSPQDEEVRKRQQRDSSQPASQQQQQQGELLLPSAPGQKEQQLSGRPESAGGDRPESAGGDRPGLKRGREEADRERDRERSSRGGSGRHRSRSRSRDRERERERDRGRRRSSRSRSRSRDRGHGNSRSSRGDGRYDRGRSDRDRERDWDRQHRDSSRELAGDRDKHRQLGRERERDRGAVDGSKDKHQPQPADRRSTEGGATPVAGGNKAAAKGEEQPKAANSKYPPPPGSFPPPPSSDGASAGNGSAAVGDQGSKGADAARTHTQPASGSVRHSQGSSKADKPAAGTAAAAAAKPKPVAVRKKPPAAAAGTGVPAASGAAGASAPAGPATAAAGGSHCSPREALLSQEPAGS